MRRRSDESLPANVSGASAVDCDVVSVDDIGVDVLCELFARYGLNVMIVGAWEEIPGSYWGDREAGLVGDAQYVRGDTPVHSALHEGCHFICMDSARRAALTRDAGGDDDEENAVCYLQILLADHISNVGRQRMCADMDAWGYTFRLGSAKAWFEHDAEDARAWLIREGLIDVTGAITFRRRE